MEMPIFPGWETVRRIGGGGFGSVYEIQREVFGKTEKNALKVITLPIDKTEVEMLRAGGTDDISLANAVEKQASIIAQEYDIMKAENGLLLSRKKETV